MYMLSCCLEGLETPLDYSIIGEDFSAEHRTHDDVRSCGTQLPAPDFSISTGLAEGKRLVQVDTTTTAEDSTLFTEQSQAFKEVPAEQVSQKEVEPRESEPGTANGPQVNHEPEEQQETAAAPTDTFHQGTGPQVNHQSEKQQETAAAPTGVQYQGPYKNGKRHGYGILIRPCGSRFEGEFRDDAANGYGTFYHPSGDVYAGQWKDNKAHGKGRFTHADGSSYEGEWVSDVQEGYGVERWTDGSSYQGYYHGGKKNGEGRFRWPNGSIFEGQFKDNEISGEGTFHWKDGKTYTGQWVENRMQGQGRMVLADGGVHEGMYFQDRRHGPGRITWPDGHYFEGEWDAGKQVPGTGRYFDARGREMGALNEISQQTSGTAALCGKTTTASSKSSLSPHVKEAEKNKEQELTAKERLALNNALASLDQQDLRSTTTRRTADGRNIADIPEERKHRVEDGRVERHHVRENAEKKKSKRKSTQCTSSTQHSTTQQHSALTERNGLNVGSSAITNRAGGVSLDPEKSGLGNSSAAVFARREDRRECGGATKGQSHHQHHQQHYDRHVREATEEAHRQDVARKGMKNARSTGPASHAAGGGNRKRAFDGFFGRRR